MKPAPGMAICASGTGFAEALDAVFVGDVDRCRPAPTATERPVRTWNWPGPTAVAAEGEEEGGGGGELDDPAVAGGRRRRRRRSRDRRSCRRRCLRRGELARRRRLRDRRSRWCAGLQFGGDAGGDAPAEGEEEFAFGAELVDAVVVAIGDVDVAAGLFDGDAAAG